ncbi:MAG: hypothetical protein FWE98_04745 [Oscillospiraceae bacterium]|nr:hypothetical protein [Oscillospiraceae bacterium]
MKKAITSALVLLLCLLAFAACGAPEAEPEQVPIAVLAAMRVEAKQLVKRMDGVRQVKVAGRTYTRGTIGGTEVVLVQTGMGLKKAEAGVRDMIDAFQPSNLFVYGTSGALVPELEVHQVMIADSLSLEGVEGGDAIPADEALVSLAQELLPHARRVRLVAESGFSITPKAMARIAAQSGAVAIDLESYAVAKVAKEKGIPLLVIRCTANTYHYSTLPAWPKNGPIAADKAAEGTEAVIKKLAEMG